MANVHDRWNAIGSGGNERKGVNEASRRRKSASPFLAFDDDMDKVTPMAPLNHHGRPT